MSYIDVSDDDPKYKKWHDFCLFADIPVKKSKRSSYSSFYYRQLGKSKTPHGVRYPASFKYDLIDITP